MGRPSIWALPGRQVFPLMTEGREAAEELQLWGQRPGSTWGPRVLRGAWVGAAEERSARCRAAAWPRATAS